MRDFDESTITGAVLDQFADTPDPRLKTIMQSLVRHLHDFVREVEPTFEEWRFAIDFATRTGQMCDEKRQEFILLSDTLGVSMLVDAINHRKPAGATQTTVLGPFYLENAPGLPHGSDISHGLKGEPLFVEAAVSSIDGQPIANAAVDVWQADAEGFYDLQRPELSEPALRGLFRTDEKGRVRFWTIMPSYYPIPDDGPVGNMLNATSRHPNRPAHVHFMIDAPGYETLVTHLFSDESPYLDSDAVFGVKDSLVVHFAHQPAGAAPDGRMMPTPYRSLRYDFRLTNA